MKKIFTQTLGSNPTCERPVGFAPKKSTVEFLRQFARAYCPAPSPAMPGFVMN